MDEAPKPPEPALLTLIARHLVTEEFTLDQIFERYKIDQAYFDEHVEPNEFFQRVRADYTKEWNALGSTHKRIAFFAALALEENLPVLADRMGSRQSGLADAVATAKLMRELAGIAPPAPGGPNAGNQFSIHIDFGHHKVKLEAQPAPELVEEKLLEPPSDPQTKDRPV